MNRTKKFLCNTITMAIYEVVILICGIIVPRIMLKFYGSEINGLVTSITQFITYFNLVEAGLAGASIYALYKPIADKNYSTISSIVVATKNFYNKAGIIFIILLFVLAIFYPIFATVKSLSWLSICILILILGFKGVLEFFTLGKYRALLSADQRAYVISIASIAYQIIYALIVIILSYFKVNIILVYAFSLIAILVRSSILVIYAKKKYSYVDYKAEPIYEALDKRYDALFLQILGAVQTGAPILIITFLINDLKLVSVYAVFNIVLSGINSILGIFTNGLSASFGDIIARKEQETLKSSYKQFETFYYALITAVYAICYIMIMPFIRLYTEGITDANYNIPILGVLFTLNGLLYSLKTPQGMLVISAGMYKETKWRSLIQSLIIVVFGIILSFKYKIVGVLIACCLSNLYRDIDLLFFVPKNILYMEVKQTAVKFLWIVLAFLLIIAPFSFINLNINTYIDWILSAIFVGIYSCIVIFAITIIFQKDDVRELLNRFLKKAKGIKKN